ncbi:lipoprotein NlpI [Rubripirellula lacrimiformis]|uniref:Lipoprotein NlpI n=1 Tax=Rubripirellula lacrimiformis TaxID=1930273 RepID=A0A517NKJ6_9BACT|nr:tetratricopeptide repeat-containing glycosyltransferase family protein [Rubripirellula lacrimiformis]QDT07662.1 lipoprotein NlpI [Rubripirellula lacrimiformis]
MSIQSENPAATLQQAWRIHQAGDVERAAAMYRSVIASDAKNADAWVYLGIALFDQRRFDESADAYRRAIEIKPIYPIAWNNLGNSLRMLGQVDAADDCFDKSLGQDPRYLSALKNRGTLWIWSGEIERGMQWYQKGLLIDPDNAELHRNLGVIELLRGNYTAGWDHYRWRWRMPGTYRPRTSAPRWNGESLTGKTFLLYPEQGLGDAIHFVRVAATLRDRGATVVLQCGKKLIPLFSSTMATLGVHQLIEDTATPPPVDFHGSMIEAIDVLYQIDGKIDFRTDLIAPDRGYLHVSQPLVDYWKTWLDANTTGRRIGINWQGNPEHHADVYRSVALETLRPLSETADATLVNLQFGYGSEQLETCGFGDKIVRLPSHVDATEGAFTDTIAILANLDQVITTDTSIAHLAGAAGADVTLMLGRVPDWRWLESGDTTPWYPTMRLARQQRLGHWDDVVAQVAGR